MINLLPSEEKAKIVLEYRIRLLTVFFIIFSLLSFILLVPLVITYLTNSYNIKYINEVAEKLVLSEGFKESSSIAKEIRDTNRKLGILTQPLGAASREKITDIFSALFKTAFEASGNGNTVKIKEISYDQLQKKTASASATSTTASKESGIHKIIVRGNANTRELFLAFLKKIEKNPNFVSIDSPVSNLVNSTNVEFTLTIILKDKAI